MNVFYLLAAASPGNEVELSFIWGKSTLEGKIIIGLERQIRTAAVETVVRIENEERLPK